MKNLWSGRFSAETDDVVRRLNDSLPFDQRLWREDIEGSIAHATMLGETSIIAKEDADQIVEGLREIRGLLESGSICLACDAEDVHTAVEILLAQRIGGTAGKLHTARSRNDQVATDLRLFTRKAIDETTKYLVSFQEALLDAAEQELETMLPGYTHLQPAQPVLLSHHLMAYFWMFERDKGRLADAQKRANVLPLGSGALAGTTFPIDRTRVAALLEFESVTENSMDAVSDRDFIVEFLAAASLVAIHLSRFGEEIVLWNSREFGFVELSDAVATGSSMMPQKKNPDVAELARGKAGRTIGNLVKMLTVLKGLPLTYSKDLQEDKEALFDTADTLALTLPAMQRLLETAKFNSQKMSAACDHGFLWATDLADELVRRGVPFREAHERVGRIVLALSNEGWNGAPEQLKRLDPELPELDLRASAIVGRRSVAGGTAPSSVREQIARAKSLLGKPPVS